MTTTDPTTTDTYRKIAARLTMLRPQIDLKNYFAGANPNVRLYDEKPYIRHHNSRSMVSLPRRPRSTASPSCPRTGKS
ncbi:hypothetical protein ACVWZL_004266 [Bradyrhizobium sp. GM2.4]